MEKFVYQLLYHNLFKITFTMDDGRFCNSLQLVGCNLLKLTLQTAFLISCTIISNQELLICNIIVNTGRSFSKVINFENRLERQVYGN